MTLRLGLLSTARIGRQILAAAAATDRVEVVAVGSRDRTRAEAYGREHDIARVYGSYEALLADPRVDAVYVPLPNGLHHEWTMRALGAGKHVLCEKPYSPRPEEVEEAYDRAERGGLVLMEAFMYRHHPQTGIVTELVAGGAVGRLRAIRATFTFSLDNMGDVRLDPELGGGSLMDVGCYCIHASRLLAGEPVRVQGAPIVGETGVDLAFHGILRFADDVVAQIDSSFVLPRSQRLEAVGEEGSLLVQAPWRIDWGGDVLLQSGGHVRRVEVPDASSFVCELENFAEAIAGTAPPALGRADALGQARAIDALFRAGATGASVAL